MTWANWATALVTAWVLVLVLVGLRVGCVYLLEWRDRRRANRYVFRPDPRSPLIAGQRARERRAVQRILHREPSPVLSPSESWDVWREAESS